MLSHAFSPPPQLERGENDSGSFVRISISVPSPSSTTPSAPGPSAPHVDISSLLTPEEQQLLNLSTAGNAAGNGSARAAGEVRAVPAVHPTSVVHARCVHVHALAPGKVLAFKIATSWGVERGRY